MRVVAPRVPVTPHARVRLVVPIMNVLLPRIRIHRTVNILLRVPPVRLSPVHLLLLRRGLRARIVGLLPAGRRGGLVVRVVQRLALASCLLVAPFLRGGVAMAEVGHGDRAGGSRRGERSVGALGELGRGESWACRAR